MEIDPVLKASRVALSSELTSYALRLKSQLESSNKMTHSEYMRIHKLALNLIAQKKMLSSKSKALESPELAKNDKIFLEAILAIRTRLKYLNPKTHLKASIDLHKKKITYHKKTAKKLRRKLRRVSIAVFTAKNLKKAKKSELVREINAHQLELSKTELKLSALTKQLPRINELF